MLSIFYKLSTDNLKLQKNYRNITNPFHLNNNSAPGAIYATTAFGFCISLGLIENVQEVFFKKNCNVN